jgi:hypothetical protein
MRTYDATTPALAHDARLSDSTTHRAIQRLVSGGWLKRVPGRWRGNASTYRLDLSAFPAEAVEELLSKAVTTTGSEISTGSHHDSLSERKPVTVTPKPVTTTGHTSVQTSVPPRAAAATEQRSLLLPFDGGRDDGLDDYAQTVLADVPAGARPRDSAGVANVLSAARAAGWSAERLRDDLAAERHDYGRIRGGAVLVALTRLAQRPAPRPPWQPCGECSNGWIEDPDTGVPTQKCACHPSYGVTPQPAATTSSDEDQPRTLTALERVAARAAAPQYDAFRRRRHG